MTKPRRANGFYDTPAWKAARRTALRRDGYRCVVCGRDIRGVGQSRVDHIKPLRTHPELGLNLANLRSLCANHDNQSHREKGRSSTGLRDEKFVITGCDANGMPLDPAHHFNDLGRRKYDF
jgi:5-methylcytosine-specific restriction endonuclease McrA